MPSLSKLTVKFVLKQRNLIVTLKKMIELRHSLQHILKHDKDGSDIYSWYQGIHLRMTTKWWEIDMKNNMINIKSQDDFDEQLLMARDKFTVVHFFSPSCGACKALHSKVKEDKHVDSTILQLSKGKTITCLTIK